MINIPRILSGIFNNYICRVIDKHEWTDEVTYLPGRKLVLRLLEKLTNTLQENGISRNFLIPIKSFSIQKKASHNWSIVKSSIYRENDKNSLFSLFRNYTYIFRNSLFHPITYICIWHLNKPKILINKRNTIKKNQFKSKISFSIFDNSSNLLIHI